MLEVGQSALTLLLDSGVAITAEDQGLRESLALGGTLVADDVQDDLDTLLRVAGLLPVVR